MAYTAERYPPKKKNKNKKKTRKRRKKKKNKEVYILQPKLCPAKIIFSIPCFCLHSSRESTKKFSAASTLPSSPGLKLKGTLELLPVPNQSIAKVLSPCIDPRSIF